VSIQGIFYVAAHVSDLVRSKQFYVEKLGWKLGTDEPTVAGVQFGSAYLVLLAASEVPGQAVGPGGMAISVQVDSIEVEHARLIAAGVVVSQVRFQPWGEKNFTFKDPDGYEWAYGEVVPAATSH
jgi:catechol 2,3-dioxygenase-like lactoylglutathione lyase family enzyme